jgi:PleD family two-component response regulator
VYGELGSVAGRAFPVDHRHAAHHARAEEIHVTMSFGVAATSDLENADDLLRAADEALYRANSGRNRVKGAERGGRP